MNSNSKKKYNYCVEMTLPQRPAVRRRAPVDDERVAAIGPSRAAFFTRKLWKNGSRLRIRFLGGNAVQQTFVKNIFLSLRQYVNLEFVFVAGAVQSDCRIDFKTGQGSWSYVGTDNRSIPQNACTMNLGWVNARKPSAEDAGTVMHEILHFFGACHEHQRVGMFKWNKEAVYKDLQGPPNYWTKAQIDSNVLQTVNSTLLTTSPEPDRTSIMAYSFPAEWTLDGKGTPQNNVLSETDKQYLRKLYPKTVTTKQRQEDDPDEEDKEKGGNKGGEKGDGEQGGEEGDGEQGGEEGESEKNSKCTCTMFWPICGKKLE